MSILADIQAKLTSLKIPIETGVFSGTAPKKYIVAVPITDSFDIHADNFPGIDIQEVRLSLYVKGNYIKDKNALVKLLLKNEFTITDRRYVGYETETGYHHYSVDVANYYEMED